MATPEDGAGLALRVVNDATRAPVLQPRTPPLAPPLTSDLCCSFFFMSSLLIACTTARLAWARCLMASQVSIFSRGSMWGGTLEKNLLASNISFSFSYSRRSLQLESR